MNGWRWCRFRRRPARNCFSLSLQRTASSNLSDALGPGEHKMPAEHLSAPDVMVSQWIRATGTGIEAFGVLVIVAGIAWSTYLFLQRRKAERHYDAYKI